MADKRPANFSRDDAHRIARATSRQETQPYYPKPPRRKSPVFAPNAGKMVEATDGGSGAAANGGTGTATLKSDGTTSVSYVNNFSGISVPGGVYVWLWYDGTTYKVVSWDCSL